MVKRTRVGLIYTYNENWIGGTYYIQNLVCSLNMLPDAQKPHLVILIGQKSDQQRFIESVSYPYLEFKFFNKVPNRFQKNLNKICYKLFKKSLFDFRISSNDIDLLFPAKDNYLFERISNKVYWIPDLQEKKLPEFFSNDELHQRDETIKKMVNSHKPIVFSSQAAANDFKEFYKGENKLFVIHFAVHHPVIQSDPGNVLDKFKIQDPYFIVCNQFWQHKNHQLVIDALALMKDELPFKVVFTGKPQDYRNVTFYDKLIEQMKLNGVSDHIINVGFIKREEQLTLMKNSIAVVQPSLFEGWSTVVEDAKSLGKELVVSDLAVHREQYPSGYFFNPNDAKELQKTLVDVYDQSQSTLERTDNSYSKNQLKFADDFNHLIIKSHE